jgi:peptidoglycan-associated lipoprotein
MKRISGFGFAMVLALWLAGCATDQGVKPGEEEAATTTEGAATGGAVEEGAVTGQALTTDGAAARPTVMQIYFDFDSSSVDDRNRETLEAHAAYLIANPDIKLRLEGHCDERGTREYNLALGERRANAVGRMLTVFGVARDRMGIVSYGEEKPADPGHDDAAWQRNRRVEISY